MKEIDTILETSCFAEERSIDITAILDMYEKNGYQYNKSKIDFIRKYGDLEIHYQHLIWHEDMVVRIKPIEAQKLQTMDVAEEYNVFVGDELLIIGDINQEILHCSCQRAATFMVLTMIV